MLQSSSGCICLLQHLRYIYGLTSDVHIRPALSMLRSRGYDWVPLHKGCAYATQMILWEFTRSGTVRFGNLAPDPLDPKMSHM